jgi:hypothetical protein
LIRTERHDALLRRLGDRLDRIDLDALTNEQAIKLAQAQAALVSVWVQFEMNQTLRGFTGETFNRLIFNLDANYRAKYGKYPEQDHQ